MGVLRRRRRIRDSYVEEEGNEGVRGQWLKRNSYVSAADKEHVRPHRRR